MKKIIVLVCLASGIIVSGCGRPGGKGTSEPIPVKVETLRVDYSAGSGARRYSGTVEAEGETMLSFTAPGTVKAIYVSEGQFVSKGHLVAEVDDATLRNAYAATKATLDQAEDAFGRLSKLYEAGSLSEIKWVEVQSQLQTARSAEAIARKALDDAKLYAPVGGYVTKRSAEAGQNVIPGMPVIQLVNIDRVKVKISVPEKEIASFASGAAVSVDVPALGDAVFSGTICERGVSADPISRTYPVKILVNNPGRSLLVGMICEVLVNTPGHEAIVLPANVVQLGSGSATYVWTVSDGRAVRTPVTVRGYSGENVVISDGLVSGDRVIVRGWQKVSSGMKISE